MRKLIRKSKRLIKALVGRDFFPKIEYRCMKERFGSDYGGWDISIEKIDKDSIVYSFGVGEDASFDLALIDRFGLVVHAFDPTPMSINWVKSQNFPNNSILHEYGLADFDGKVSFNPPENPEHVSHTLIDRPSTAEKAIIVSVKRLVTIMRELGHNKIDILKINIEGAEYQVIDDLVKSNIRPNQVLVQFHHGFPGINLRKTKEAIRKLKELNYRLFSVSSSGKVFCFIHIPS